MRSSAVAPRPNGIFAPPCERLPRWRALAIAGVLLALVCQVGLMTWIGNHAYGDLLKSVNFGYLVHVGAFDLQGDFVNSKTFVGPLLNYWIFANLGLAGLHAANLLLLVLLVVLIAWAYRPHVDDGALLAGLFLLLFYPGTHRSLAVGELDDQLATACLALALVAMNRGGRSLAAALCLGFGFLFKFWMIVFAGGWVLYLAARQPLRHLAPAIAGLVAPFLLVSLVDRGASWRSFSTSASIQVAFSTWTFVAFKLLSTGLLPAAVIAVLAWRRDRRPVVDHAMAMFLAYPVYVVVARDAWAASTMMMTCLVIMAPWLARWGLSIAPPTSPRTRRAALALSAAVYIALGLFITVRRLTEEVWPVRLVESVAEAREMFPYNPPPRSWRPPP